AAGADMLARVSGAGQGRAAVQPDGKGWEGEGSDSDWTGPSGCRISGKSLSRDGGDDGWVRCGVGLGAAELCDECGERRGMGEFSSWRRSGDGLQPACGTGGGGRR